MLLGLCRCFFYFHCDYDVFLFICGSFQNQFEQSIQCIEDFFPITCFSISSFIVEDDLTWENNQMLKEKVAKRVDIVLIYIDACTFCVSTYNSSLSFVSMLNRIHINIPTKLIAIDINGETEICCCFFLILFSTIRLCIVFFSSLV